jgi:hypothetical protein
MTDRSGKPHRGVQLEPTQIVAGSLAAVTAAVAASYLGVAGTIIGAAVGSVVGTVGTTVYEHYLHRTRHQVRTVVLRVAPTAIRQRAASDAAPAEPATAESASDGEPRDGDKVSTLSWLRAQRGAIAIATALVFVAGMSVVTAVEVLAGKKLKEVVKNEPGSGTTVFGGDQPARVPATSTPTATTPTPTVTVTSTPTAMPTATATTTATTEPSPSPSDTQPASGSQAPPVPTVPAAR